MITETKPSRSNPTSEVSSFEESYDSFGQGIAINAR